MDNIDYSFNNINHHANNRKRGIKMNEDLQKKRTELQVKFQNATDTTPVTRRNGKTYYNPEYVEMLEKAVIIKNSEIEKRKDGTVKMLEKFLEVLKSE